eukprot:scaffold4510_cov183-Amphora_coffeaeformis.AAC.55
MVGWFYVDIIVHNNNSSFLIILTSLGLSVSRSQPSTILSYAQSFGSSSESIMNNATLVLFLSGCFFGWSLWDVVKLRTWERTQGTIMEYRQVQNKSGRFQQPLISFPAASTKNSDDNNGSSTTEEYAFWSKIRQDDIQTEYPVSSSVPVMYSVQHPSRGAEMVDKIRAEAQAMLVVAVFILGLAVSIWWCQSLVVEQRPPQQEPNTNYVAVKDDAMSQPPIATKTNTGQMV